MTALPQHWAHWRNKRTCSSRRNEKQGAALLHQFIKAKMVGGRPAGRQSHRGMSKSAIHCKPLTRTAEAGGGVRGGALCKRVACAERTGARPSPFTLAGFSN